MNTIKELKSHLIFGGAVLAVLAIFGVTSPEAKAAPDEVLCSSNIAYRNMPKHKDECKDIGINSHGGGGALDVTTDSDGDGTPDFRDKHPDDPTAARATR